VEDEEIFQDKEILKTPAEEILPETPQEEQKVEAVPGQVAHESTDTPLPSVEDMIPVVGAPEPKPKQQEPVRQVAPITVERTGMVQGSQRELLKQGFFDKMGSLVGQVSAGFKVIMASRFTILLIVTMATGILLGLDVAAGRYHTAVIHGVLCGLLLQCLYLMYRSAVAEATKGRKQDDPNIPMFTEQ